MLAGSLETKINRSRRTVELSQKAIGPSSTELAGPVTGTVPRASDQEGGHAETTLAVLLEKPRPHLRSGGTCFRGVLGSGRRLGAAEPLTPTTVQAA